MNVRFEGFDDLNKRLNELGHVQDWGYPIMDKAVKFVHSKVPSYPAPRRAPQLFSTERQRRWFFWALGEGIIEVPYRRTNQLGRSITTQVRPLGNGIVGTIGTATVYAGWVISSEQTPMGTGPQSSYHKGHWWTLQQVVADNTQGVLDILEREIRRLLRR